MIRARCHQRVGEKCASELLEVEIKDHSVG